MLSQPPDAVPTRLNEGQKEAVLLKPKRLWVKRTTLQLWWTVSLYTVISLFLFFSWINPSLTQETDHHIAADSGTYVYFADSLREGRNDPWVLSSMTKFPNNLWGPVLLWMLLPNTVAIVALNYAILFFAVWLFHRAGDLNIKLLFFLILANVTTFISLLSLNKEILDLLVVALFVYYLGHGRKVGRWVALTAALLISIVCRFETAVCFMAYLAIEWRWNIFRHRRIVSLTIVVLALSFSLPTFISGAMNARIDEALATGSSGGLMLLLDDLQMHYLFFLAVIPKILDNLFAQLVSFSSWASYSLEDAANTIFLFGNNLASLLVIVVIVLKKRFRLRSDLILLACLTAIIMSTSPVIQPRYFYGFYIILCVEAARKHPRRRARPGAFRKTPNKGVVPIEAIA